MDDAGKFDYGDISFMDYAKDRKGNSIERYNVSITLRPDEDEYQGWLDIQMGSHDSALTAIIQEYNGDPTDIEGMDEIAHDYLMNDLSAADAARDKHAAEAIKVKIRIIEAQMRKLDPSYTHSIDQPMQLNEWNPPRNVTPEEFYQEFEYYFGNNRLDEAVSLYMHFHSSESADTVRGRMQRVAERLSPQV